MSELTHEQMIDKLREVVKDEGSQFAAAQSLDISPAYLSDILTGKRKVSDRLARRLGFRREFAYRHNGPKAVE